MWVTPAAINDVVCGALLSVSARAHTFPVTMTTRVWFERVSVTCNSGLRGVIRFLPKIGNSSNGVPMRPRDIERTLAIEKCPSQKCNLALGVEAIRVVDVLVRIPESATNQSCST